MEKDTLFTPNKKTKDNISFSLFRLLFKKDYQDISITEICQLANISRTTFYRYYRDKRDILVDFTDERFEEFFENLKTNYKTVSFRDILIEVMSIIHRNRLQIMKLIEAGMADILHDQFHYYFRYLFRKTSIKESTFTLSDIQSPQFIYGASFFAGGVYGAVLNWAEHNMEGTPEEMTTYVIDALGAVMDINPFKPIIFY